MVSSKHATKIVVVLMTVAMILSLGAVGYSSKLTELFGGTGVSMEYESKLFDTDEVMTVDIQMDEDDWNDMLANAMTEEYYACDVVINGKRVNNVAIRPKGNTSLSAIVSNPDSDRYSFKLEFDHFVDGQTCYGLDKLILNNNYADSTNMKEAVIYDMYQFIGADASLYNYAEVSVNGEYTGVYLALEGVESSFMLRNFGTQDGELYKPESMGMGGGEKEDSKSSTSSNNKPDMDFSQVDKSNFDPKNMPARDESSQDNSNDNKANQNDNTSENSDDKSSQDKNMPGQNDSENKSRPQGGFSKGGNGANLNYTDDDLDSYSTIWDGEITSTGKKDHKRVVKALKNISEGKNLEKYLDMDNILKYMAVHTFVVNMDSLSGSMAHNYYLYEYKGQLNMLPWDYNLSFGGMSMGGTDGSGVVNDAIDTPFSGTNFFDAILEDEEYSAKYHEYLQKLVDEYVNGGRFEEVYNRIRSQINELVKTDPTAFYNYDEYEAGAEMLYKTIMLRAESVKGQLDGTIPSTDEGQKADSSSLVDASEIDVKVMGQMNMGGGSGGFGGFGAKPGESQSDSDDKKESGEDSKEESSENSKEDSSEKSTEKKSDRSDVVDNSTGSATTLSANTVNTVSEAPGNFDPSNMPEGFDPEDMPEGFNPGDMPGGNSNQSGNDEKETESVSDDKDSKGGNNNQNNVTDNQNNSNEKSTENVDDNGKSESNDKSDNSNSDSNNNSDKSNSRFSDKNMPSFSGMNNSSNDKTTEKNLIIYGVCFALMILSLIVLKLMKRNY